MATPTDDFGRSAPMDAETLRSMLQGNVGTPKQQKNDDSQTKSLADIDKILTKFAKDYKKDADEAKKHIDEIAAYLKDLKKRKEKKKAEPKPGKKKSDSSKAEAVMEELAKAAGKGKGGGGGGGKKGGGGVPSGGGGGGGRNMRNMAGLPMLVSETNMELFIFQNILSKVMSATYALEKAFLSFNVIPTLFGDDLIKQEIKFTQEMRALAYEVGGVSKEYEKLGDTVKYTGKNRTEFQDAFTKRLKSGIKDQKKALGITMSQLNTEEQLGLKAGELGATYDDWTQHLGMSQNQITEMGRGLRDVARYTGVTGENLTKAVASSEQFTKSMSNAATLTAAAAKNIIEISANAQKLGVTDSLNPILKAMTSTNAFFKDANQQTKALLVNSANSVGRLGDLMNGTIAQSKDGLKDMAKGMEMSLKKFGVTSLDSIDQMSDQAKMILNMQIKSAYGIELGEFRKIIETMKESSKGLSDRLEDINKKREQNLTLEEKTALMEEERKLKTSKALEVMTALGEAAKGAGKGAAGMNQALSKFGERRKDFEKDMDAMGQKWTSEADIARSAIQNALEGANASLKKGGKKELKIDSSEIEKALSDPEAFRELTAKIGKAEQEAATAAKAQLDPLTAMKQSLMEINDTLRQFAQSFISKMMNSVVGKLIVLGSVLLSIATSAVLAIMQLVLIKESLREMVAMFKAWRGLKDEKKDDNKAQKANEAAHKEVAKESAVPATEKKLKGDKDKNLKGGGVAGASVGGGPGAEMDSKAMMQAGELTALNGAALMVLGAGLVVLATAVVFIASKVLKGLKLDAKTVMDTALAVAAIIGTAAAICAAAVGAMEAMEAISENRFIKSPVKAAKTLRKGALAILVIGPALVLLGAAIIKLSQGIMGAFGLDSETAAKIAEDVSSIIIAAGKIALGVIVAMAGLAVLGLLAKVAWKAAPLMLIGAGALLLLTPALLLLATAILKLSQGIMKVAGMDSSTAATIAKDVGDILGAAGEIAKSCLLSVASLSLLGLVVGSGLFPLIAVTAMAGAMGIILMIPAMSVLSIAILKLAKAIMGVFKMDAKKAAEVADGLSGIISAAGQIAKSCVGAGLALSLLGLAVSSGIFPIMAALGMAGALGILLIIPAMSLLAIGIVKMAGAILGAFNMDAKKAAEVAQNLSGIIDSAGKIAEACVEAGAYLALLGLAVTSGIFPIVALLGMAGAVGILLMVPAMTRLAIGIVSLAKGIMGQFNMDGKQAGAVAENLSKIIWAASKIAGACLLGGAALAILGVAVMSGIFYVAAALAIPGAAGLVMLIPAMTALASAIIQLSMGVLGAIGMDKKMAEDIADSVATIMWSAAKISLAVVASSAALAALGMAVTTGMFFLAKKMATKGAKALIELSEPMRDYLVAVMILAYNLSFVNAKRMTTVATNVATALKAAGDITTEVMAAKDHLKTIKSSEGFWVFSTSAVDSMYEGVKAFKELQAPLIAYVNAIVNFAESNIDINRLTASGKSLLKLSSIIKIMPQIMDGMSKALIKMGSPGRLNSGALSGWMEGLSKSLPEMTVMADVINRLTALVEVVRLLGDLTKNMNAADMTMLDPSKINKLGSALSTLNMKNSMTSNSSSGEARTTALPSSNVDIEQRIQQEKAATTAAVAMGSSPELSQIASSSEQAASSSSQMVNLLQTLVSYMRPAGGSGGGAATPQSTMTMTSPPKYYKWNTGKHNQTAGKNVTNIGAVNA